MLSQILIIQTMRNFSLFSTDKKKRRIKIIPRFQQYEDIFFAPELSASIENLKTSSTASTNLQKQKGEYFDFYFNYSLEQDLRNQRYQPTDGYKSRFTQELPMISDYYEIANSFETTAYRKFGSDMVGKVSFYASAVNNLTDDNVRISKRLTMPSNKLRGFEKGRIGPKDKTEYIGGNYIAAFNIATTLPQLFPSLENFDFSYNYNHRQRLGC